MAGSRRQAWRRPLILAAAVGLALVWRAWVQGQEGAGLQEGAPPHIGAHEPKAQRQPAADEPKKPAGPRPLPPAELGPPAQIDLAVPGSHSGRAWIWSPDGRLVDSSPWVVVVLDRELSAGAWLSPLRSVRSQRSFGIVAFGLPRDFEAAQGTERTSTAKASGDWLGQALAVWREQAIAKGQRLAVVACGDAASAAVLAVSKDARVGALALVGPRSLAGDALDQLGALSRRRLFLGASRQDPGQASVVDKLASYNDYSLVSWEDGPRRSDELLQGPVGADLAGWLYAVLGPPVGPAGAAAPPRQP